METDQRASDGDRSRAAESNGTDVGMERSVEGENDETVAGSAANMDLLSDSEDDIHETKTDSEEIEPMQIQGEFKRQRMKRKRKPRLSQWRRKKKQRLNDCINPNRDREEKEEETLIAPIMEMADRGDEKDSCIAEVPQETSTLDSTFSRAKKEKKVIEIPPVIRSLIFYRTYSGKLVKGFSKHHIFNRLSCRDPGSISTNSIKPLFFFIFDKERYDYMQRTEKQIAIGAIKAKKNKGESRVSTKRYGDVLLLLKQMKANQLKHGDKIKYLLLHHCPVGEYQIKDPESLDTHSSTLSHIHSSDRDDEEDDRDSNADARMSDISMRNPHKVHEPPTIEDTSPPPPLTIPNTPPDEMEALESNLFHKRANEKRKVGSREKLEHEELVQQFSSYHQVSCFLKVVCSRLIPQEIWGSEQNRTVFHKHLDRFISLGRYEVFTLHEAYQGLRLGEVPWLNDCARPDPSKHIWRQKTMLQMLHFIFSSIVIPLIQINFYCTESNSNRTTVHYYRKDLWYELSDHSWTRLTRPELASSSTGSHPHSSLQSSNKHGSENSLLCNTSVYRPLTNREYRSMLARQTGNSESCSIKPGNHWHKLLPYGRVRLLPKETTVRPIINLGKKRKLRLSYGEILQSTNSMLSNALHIMKFEHSRQPELLGSSVFNPVEIYKRLLPFVKLWRQQIALKRSHLQRLGKPHDNAPVPLYFATVDVRGAYDSIPHEKLIEIIEKKVFNEDEYMVVKFHVVRPYLGRIAIRYERQVMLVSEFQQVCSASSVYVFVLTH